MNNRRPHIVFAWISYAVLVFCLLSGNARAQVDLLPDIITRETDLYNNDITTNIVPGRTHLRLNNGTANVGDGPLELLGQWPPDTNGITVNQRVYRSDGSWYDRLAGVFVYHPGHNHTHFEAWAGYRLREILPENGVGDIVASSEKTSFCIADLAVHNATLPNFDPDGNYFTCDNLVQGISVGWVDIYSKSLPSQNIDITDVPDGTYWLESEADPFDQVLESDETNNIARIIVVLGNGAGTLPDAFEPNDSIAGVDARPAGHPNSPNLGPCGPLRTIPDLSIHSSGNNDFYKFYLNHTGTSADFVRVAFQHSLGDIDMHLLNASGQSIDQSTSTTNSETISFDGVPEGWYYVRVYGFNGTTNPIYSLTVNPPENTPPSITVLNPPAGDTVLIHSFDTYTTTWSVTDAENDQTWVTVYVNTTPAFDGNEVVQATSLYTDGAQGFHVITSAEFPAGTYWVFCEVTDGGTVTGSWSDGTITFVIPTDNDSDGVFDFDDNCPYFYNPAQVGCVAHGDPQFDGVTDIVDVTRAVEIAFRGGTPILDGQCPHVPAGRTDVDCDGDTDVFDVTLFVEVAFRGGVDLFCNPCTCNPYPSGCP